jgi:hypothetical protein
MEFSSTHDETIARLKAETQMIRKKRYKGVIGLLLGGAGFATMLAGLPDVVSYGLWGVGAAAWFILKRA